MKTDDIDGARPSILHYVKEKKDTWEDLFYELLVGIGKGVGPLTLEEYFLEKGEEI